MDLSYLLFLAGLLILILSIGVILNIAPPMETFENEQYFLSMNKCGRELSFPNFSSVNLAAQRATDEQQLTQNISRGSCIIPMNNEGNARPSESYSIVKDNYMYYSLKRTCLGLRYQNIEILNDTRFAITFNTSTEADAKAFMYFMLLNPLFVEFNVSSDKGTVAYYPVYHSDTQELARSQDPKTAAKEFKYSNYGKEIRGREVISPFFVNNPRIVFEVVLPRGDRGKDSLFNYYTDGNPYVYITHLNYAPEGMINLQLYFLDDNIPTSYQNVGKALMHPHGGSLFDVPHLFYDYNSNKNDLLVFRTDYNERFSQNSAFKDIYEFNNNINVFYKNYIQPVFTISYDLMITDQNIKGKVQNANVVIARMFMDNNFGNYNTCSSVTNELTSTRNNNIFMLVLETGSEYDTGYGLVLVLGRGNECNYNSGFVDRSNAKITLPFLTGTNKVRLVFTLTPNEKILTAFWKDPGTFRTNVSLSRTNYCGEDLNLHRLFKQKPRQAPIGNIKMNIHGDVVSKVNYVALGYKNLLAEHEKYT